MTTLHHIIAVFHPQIAGSVTGMKAESRMHSEIAHRLNQQHTSPNNSLRGFKNKIFGLREGEIIKRLFFVS